ncbi:hypothetical protein [Microcystis phage Mel-JY01]
MNKSIKITNCDDFKIRDRVWSESYGFGTITGYSTVDGVLVGIEVDGFSCTFVKCDEFKILQFPGSPIVYFHAVADTDEDMREIISREV